MSVIIKTTKGKNERIEFAATEKAKVWTSVRIKYLAVVRASMGERRCERSREGGDGSALATVEMGGVVTGSLHRSRRLKMSLRPANPSAN